MTTTTLKKHIHKTIDTIDDTVLLEAVYTILKKNAAQKKMLQPITEAEFYSRNQKSQKDILEGKLVSQSLVKKRYTSK